MTGKDGTAARPQAGPRTVAGTTLQRISLGGTAADLVRGEDLRRMVVTALGGSGHPLLLASANLDHVHHFGAGGAYDGFFTSPARHPGWLVTLDGAPLVAAAQRVTGASWPPLTGAEWLPGLLALAEEHGARVGLLGATADVHRRLRVLAAERWPRLELSGTWLAGPAELGDPAERARLADEIRVAGTDVLAVCLGKPRQELWLDEFAGAAGIRVGACFGGAANAMVGENRRAPEVVQRMGAEWLWRLASEPRRLWRRYLVQGPPAYLRLRRPALSYAASQTLGPAASVPGPATGGSDR